MTSDGTTLFLASFTLRETRYMVSGSERSRVTRLVRAADKDTAETRLREMPEFKTDEYAVYRDIEGLDLSEVVDGIWRYADDQ